MIGNNKTTITISDICILTVIVGTLCNLGLNTIIEKQNEDILRNQTEIVQQMNNIHYSIGDTANYIVEQIKNSQAEKLNRNLIEEIDILEEIIAPESSIDNTTSDNIVEDILTTKNKLPTGDTSFKTYMDYRTITDKTSAQYKLQQEAYTDDKGMRLYQDYYIVAMGTYYTNKVGDMFRITLENGIFFNVIVGDIKADSHTDNYNMYSPIYNADGELISANILEFIVDVNVISQQVKKLGTVSAYDEFKGNIVKIERIDEYGINSNC